MPTQLTPPESPRVAHALKPGDTVMEYVIERTLGGGGFGITYLARDKHLNLPVAIKEYLPGELALRSADDSVHSLGDAFEEQFQWGLERFLDEARVLATFRHPNIVRVLRYFIVNGTGYIVMEYESGKSLKHWLPYQGALTQASLLKLLHPLLDGLEVIHNANFMHRDIKPDNIYVRDDGSPVLIDFGSARSIDRERELTNIVSPGFAPLEQYHSKGNQGPWTDLYSLAAVMYWLISGNKPLDSISRLKQDSMVPATQIENNGRFDASLLKAIDWALSPEETHRPQTAAEFRRCLHEAVKDATSVTSSNSQGWQSSNTESGVISNRITTAGETLEGNLVCSILFLDIVAYSKTSGNEQYQNKSLFNQLIAEKLAHIPENSRITLDTGDGAAICFLGDPEKVLLASLEVRQALVVQDRLQVRMGLHIGPVRIINDLNGHNNVIGDGINVAQRVMSFAESNTLVVSRAFYEIVERLSDHSAKSFEYIGERRDKHDRAHELYIVSTIHNVEEQSDKTIRFDEVPSEKTIQFNASLDLDLRGGVGEASSVDPMDVFTDSQKKVEPASKSLLMKFRTGIIDAFGVIFVWSADNYWWKLALTTLSAYCAGWIFGGTTWGIGLGVTTLFLGELNFIRMKYITFKKNRLEEANSTSIPLSSRWSRRNILWHVITIVPSILIVVFLGVVSAAKAKHPDEKQVAVVSPPVAVVAEIEKPKIVQEQVKTSTKLPSSERSEIHKPKVHHKQVKTVAKPPSDEGDAETQVNLKIAQKKLAEKHYADAISHAQIVLNKHPKNATAKEIISKAKDAQLSSLYLP